MITYLIVILQRCKVSFFFSSCGASWSADGSFTNDETTKNRAQPVQTGKKRPVSTGNHRRTGKVQGWLVECHHLTDQFDSNKMHMNITRGWADAWTCIFPFQRTVRNVAIPWLGRLSMVEGKTKHPLALSLSLPLSRKKKKEKERK